MVRILICDDDAIFAAHLKQLLERYTAELGISCRITVLHDPERISDTMLQGCEIAFLDIDMPGRMSGIEVARNLRQMRRDSVIVFVTNYIEYAPEGYEVQAFAVEWV